MIPRNPDSVPSANAETADAPGIRNTRHEITNAATTPAKAAYGAATPRCFFPEESRRGCSAMK